ncbi:methylenetetrahydrofolate reductase [Betaproteobacteria bacterium]|nr:methylenetetrahydrofolate reductase [Betaproteobacteria bacterium]
MVNHFKQALLDKQFVVTCELIPGRGANAPAQQQTLETGLELWQTGRVHAISITDNPGGRPALLADSFAADFLAAGATPLVHTTCKDRNRNAVQSQLYAMQRAGIENVLVMTGDYPTAGWKGRARPVFDLDPVQLLKMIDDANAGMQYAGIKGNLYDEKAEFFAGCVVSPFKWTEAETLTQYNKLKKKLVAGAKYVITQVGYDARKMQELLWWLQDANMDVPVIANVYLTSLGTGRIMKRGGIPGCFVSDELLSILEKEAKSADKGFSMRLQRAAQTIAIAKGLGYAGVHIGGIGLNAEVLNTVLDMSDELADSWRELAAGLQFGRRKSFYVYESDGNGLNVRNFSPRTEVDNSRAVQKGYGLSRFFHKLVLTRDRGFYGVLKGVMDRRERKRGKHRTHNLEHLGKTMLYGCLDCGDCGLETTIYSCPMTACAKCQRNGPCGGSTDGWCEVYPGERFCIYYKAYHRLKKYGELHKLGDFIAPPNNWDYFETSGWSNYTHERDNAANRQFLDDKTESGQD